MSLSRESSRSHWHHRHCCILQGGEDKGEEGRAGVGIEVAVNMALC